MSRLVQISASLAVAVVKSGIIPKFLRGTMEGNALISVENAAKIAKDGDPKLLDGQRLEGGMQKEN